MTQAAVSTLISPSQLAIDAAHARAVGTFGRVSSAAVQPPMQQPSSNLLRPARTDAARAFMMEDGWLVSSNVDKIKLTHVDGQEFPYPGYEVSHLNIWIRTLMQRFGVLQAVLSATGWSS